MSNVYTYKVKSGEISELRDFAIECSRSFGALLWIRENPVISLTTLEDSHKRDMERLEGKIRDLQDQLKRLEGMSPDEAQEEAEKEHKTWIALSESRWRESLELQPRYQEMSEKVKRWNPPTPDHQGLKDFMLEILRTSIRFECMDSPPYVAPMGTGERWLEIKALQIRSEIDYSTEELEKCKSIAATNTKWLSDLLESLK